MEKMKPILFNTEMVRAILDGKKTVTRRLIKPQPDNKHQSPLGYCTDSTGSKKDIGKYGWGIDEYGGHIQSAKPPCRIRDILYVRETFADTWTPSEDTGYVYKADGEPSRFAYWGNASSYKSEVWRPSLHMPKEAARIFLKVTDVRAERLQDMTDEDCMKEGISEERVSNIDDMFPNLSGCNAEINGGSSEKCVFSDLWDSTVLDNNHRYSANPWVWVIKFERVSKEDVK